MSGTTPFEEIKGNWKTRTSWMEKKADIGKSAHKRTPREKKTRRTARPTSSPLKDETKEPRKQE